MIRLAGVEIPQVRHWFNDERPGPDAIATHTLETGVGGWWTDRWPDPNVILVETAGNALLRGDPTRVTVNDLRPIVGGFIDAPPEFEPLLREISDHFRIWERVIYAEPVTGPLPPRQARVPRQRDGRVEVRRLGAADAHSIATLDPMHGWISKTWGGPSALAESGYAWGGFLGDRLVAVACTFFLGSTYEDLGVVTQPGQQRKGLSTRCARALITDVRARGHRPSWTTSLDNVASRRVAEKLGMAEVRKTVLYVVGIPLPG